MLALTDAAMTLIGFVLALWVAGAAWALYTGLALRRGALLARAEAERLSALLEAGPALPVLVRGDGRLDAPARLATWLGLDAVPGFISELTADDGGLAAGDGKALAADVLAAQRAGRRFSRSIGAAGAARSIMVRGGPGDADHSGPGTAMLWFFDATESQSEIEALASERDRLRDALEALAGLIEAAPMPMWHRDADLRLGLVNSAYVDWVEAESAAQVIREGMELIEAQAGLTPAEAAARAMQEGKPLARLVPATVRGERRMMRVVDVPLGPAGIAGFAIDMHELVEARSEYRRLMGAQRDMLDRLSAAVAQFGPDRTLQFANQPFCSLFGLQAEKLADGPEFDRVLDQMREAGRLPEHRDFPAWRAEHGQWFLSPDPREENWLLADGTHLRVFAQPLPDGGLLLIFEDRTEQLQLSSARDTLLRVRTATFDNLFEAVGVFSSDGKLSVWNNRFRRVWGVEEDVLAGHPRVDQFMARVAPSLAKPQQAGIVQELVRAATLERRQRSGHVVFADGRHFDFAAIPLPDGNALFAMLDVTDGRRMEQALRDRNEALEQGDRIKTAFLSNMSYELRTPLTSIAGFAQMLEAGYAGDLTDQGRDYVRAIIDSTDRLGTLIDNVLDLTQGEAGSLPLDRKPLDLAALVRTSAAKFEDAAREKRIDLAVRIEPTLGTAAGDERRISQAISHLLENALAYSHVGGRVLVHADGTDRTARIVVSDDGPGMDAAAQARAFDRFSRVGADGTVKDGGVPGGRGETLGVGLPLARQFVEAHGGTIDLISRPGEGTAVTIALPRG